MPNDPRWPSVMSFRYISRISSFDARVVMISDTHASSTFRRNDFSRASRSVIPGNIFGMNTFRATCCVIVLAAGHVVAPAAQVRNRRADDADRIDARMLVEPPVFDREHGLLHRDRESRRAPPAAAFRVRRRRRAWSGARRRAPADRVGLAPTSRRSTRSAGRCGARRGGVLRGGFRPAPAAAGRRRGRSARAARRRAA